MSGSAADPLQQLAALRGVAVSYEDAFDHRREVGPDTLVAILAALGEPIERPADAPACLAARAAAPTVPPAATVAWDGLLDPAALVQLGLAGAGEAIRLELEDGSDASELLVAPPDAAPCRLPHGLHRLLAGTLHSLVISAPRRARPVEPFSWGLFAPTYALIDERRRQVGDLTSLQRLGSLAGSLGASYVATLPLLADYSSADAVGAVTSPYSPLSRMWWNEGFLDLARVPGAGGVVTPEPAPGRYADVAQVAARVRASLALVIDRVHASGDRTAAYEGFLRERPDVFAYAAFRAAAVAHGVDRDAWPARLIAGDIRPGVDVARDEVEVHVCAQWLTDEQIGEAAGAMAPTGCRLMLDLPIGCRPDGYDTWRYPSSFAGGSRRVEASHGVSVGAPPDRFFSGGQDWGFRPLDPEGERQAGYPVVRGSLCHLLRHAGALRIDHILGFQRLWWIPAGASARDGAYVNYPAEELLALSCLEAWRHDATLIGEDLGTVDPTVRLLLGQHGVAGMSVAVFELEARPGKRLEVPAGCCALVDTHDTATFAGWLDGTDIEDRLHLGLEDAADASSERAARSEAVRGLLDRFPDTAKDARSVHARLLEELGSSQAGVVIATLEDLWGEHDPQNIPGTITEHANFARRASFALADIEQDEAFRGPLLRLAAARRAAASAALQPPTAAQSPAGGEACSSPAAGKVCT